MKAITLWQPYASLVAIGAKPDETRSWSTDYRGPIAIHAGLGAAHELDGMTSEAISLAFGWAYDPYAINIASRIKELPHGAVVATANLVECWKVTGCHDGTVVLENEGGRHRYIEYGEQYLHFGDYSTGRYIWQLDDARALPEPIPAKGRQRIWNWQSEEGEKG